MKYLCKKCGSSQISICEDETYICFECEYEHRVYNINHTKLIHEEDILTNLGINVRNAAGEFRNMTDILTEISNNIERFDFDDLRSCFHILDNIRGR